ncbi:MAG: outer membrane beta-barrel protein [Cohaesibacter sp.]|nr:outer membrane beta-barrel protein [Cohaesibacter sp.]
MANGSLPLMVLGLGCGLCVVGAAAQTYHGSASLPDAQDSVWSSHMQLRGLSDQDGSDFGLADDVAEPAPTARQLDDLAVVPPSYPVQSVQPEGPIQSNARSSEIFGPYEATGLSVGSFDLYPSLTFWVRGDDNVDNSQSAQSSRSGRIEGDVRFQSNWSRHQLSGRANVNITGYQSPKRQPDHDYTLEGDLRLDLGAATTLTLRSGLDIEREAANSVELRASSGTRSIQTVLSGGAQLDHQAGLFEVQLRGGLASETFDQDKSRDFQLFTLGGRAGYRYTDQVVPFVDVEMSRRSFDQGPNAQDGDRLRGAIGVSVRNRDKWSGDFSVGQIVWKPDQAGQTSDRGFYADANLIWSPNALWQITAGLETSLSSTSTAASSVLSHQFTLGADYEVRRNLTLGADLSVTRQAYKGIGRKDWVSRAGLDAQYRLSRNAQLVGRYQHDRRSSTASGEDFTSNLFELGVRFQK